MLLLCLLEADCMMKEALTELMVLPADALERLIVLPILLKIRLEIPADPAKQTKEDQEFLMTTQDAVDTWQQEVRAEARAEDVLVVLRVRGIAVPEAARKRILAEKNLQRLERWLEQTIAATSLREVIADQASDRSSKTGTPAARKRRSGRRSSRAPGQQ